MSDLRTSPMRMFQNLQPRERRAVGIAATVLAAYLLWAVMLAPALQTLRTLPEQQARADQQLAEMQTLAQEARQLKERSRGDALPRADALRALELATRQTLGTTARITPAGNRVTVVFSGASPDALAQWLAQARLNARLLPVESRLQRGGEGAGVHWSGTVVLGGRALADSP